MAYTQDNLRQAINTREGQSHISCVPSWPNQLHPQVQPPLTFVICRRIDADRHQCLPSSHVIRMNTKKIYPSLLCRVLSVCSTAFIVLIWPQPPLSHILSHRSSHFSCQSVHHLISATLFVSIPSSSHLSLSKSSVLMQLVLSFAGRLSSEVAQTSPYAAMLLIGVQAVKRFSYRFGVR